MLELVGIDAGYGHSRVLVDVSLSAPTGITAILGNNGAGKTTLLRVAMGLIKPTTGTVRWEGEDITSLPPSKRVHRGIAYVPQGQQSFAQLSTLENLQLIADGHKDAKGRIDRALATFPVLETVLTKKAGLLSGGQRQQLAIARALITNPRLLVLDEPTEGIQPSVVAEIERMIIGLAEDGLKVLLVEQHVGFAVSAATTYFVLASGRLVSSGTGGINAVSDVRFALAI